MEKHLEDSNVAVCISSKDEVDKSVGGARACKYMKLTSHTILMCMGGLYLKADLSLTPLPPNYL